MDFDWRPFWKKWEAPKNGPPEVREDTLAGVRSTGGLEWWYTVRGGPGLRMCWNSVPLVWCQLKMVATLYTFQDIQSPNLNVATAQEQL